GVLWRLARREAPDVHAVINDVQLPHANAIRLSEMLPIVVRTRHNGLCSPQLFRQQELFAPDVISMGRGSKRYTQKARDNHGSRGGPYRPVGVEMVDPESLNSW